MANFGPRTPSTESSTCSAEGSEHASSLRRSFSRSRSPIPRLKQLFSLKSPPPSFASLESFANAPPIEVIINVGRHLSSPRDVLSVSLTCRQARAALLPRLYNTVELRSNKSCRSALEAFSKRSEITQHIQTLTVRPNNTERTPSGEHLDELLVSNLIIVIASRLPSLHSFYWDGLEMPDDKLWLALRKFCPRLKCIGTSVGTLPLDTLDALFDFRDLLKFSFTVRCDSLTWLTEGRPSVEKLPRRLWQMLLERCPGLTELTIGGSAPSPRLFDTRHVMAGRWPRLRKLTLGETIILHASQDESAPETQALNKFLAAHPTLREIAFQHPGTYGYPDSLLLPKNALPRVESFSGPPRYVRALTHPARLKSLAITTLHHCPSAFPPTCAILHGFPSLTSLSIWIDLSFARRNPLHDGGNIFRTILECCPRLIHFDVSCFTRPTFHVKEFSAALTRSPQLRSFSLTKIHKQSDEDMNQTAMRIAHDNPNIQKFSLRYSLDTWLTHSTGRIKQFGDYEVLTRPDGLPGSMVGYEWGVRTFGSPYSRHYVQDLRPPRSKQASRSSWSSPLEEPQSPRPQSVLSVQPSVSHSVHWQPSVSHSVHWH